MLKNDIQVATSEALKSGNSFVLGVLRMLSASIQTKEKDKRHKTYQAKFDMTLPGKKNGFFAKHSHSDLTAAITGLREAIEKQIKKYKHTN